MKKWKVSVTFTAELYAENEEDLEETLRSTFKHPLPHLVKNDLKEVIALREQTAK